MTDSPPARLSGRRAQAATNDGVILEAARAVFTADPSAPISAVAQHAGVGISALYRRYPGKEDLLRTLAADGLQRFIDELETALADDRDPWTAFADFMRRAVDANTSSLTRALAGTFTPTPEMWAERAASGGVDERAVRAHARGRRPAARPRRARPVPDLRAARSSARRETRLAPISCGSATSR